MDLYEHQGKDLFARHGIPVPRGIVAETVYKYLRPLLDKDKQAKSTGL